MHYRLENTRRSKRQYVKINIIKKNCVKIKTKVKEK